MIRLCLVLCARDFVWWASSSLGMIVLCLGFCVGWVWNSVFGEAVWGLRSWWWFPGVMLCLAEMNVCVYCAFLCVYWCCCVCVPLLLWTDGMWCGVVLVAVVSSVECWSHVFLKCHLISPILVWTCIVLLKLCFFSLLVLFWWIVWWPFYGIVRRSSSKSIHLPLLFNLFLEGSSDGTVGGFGRMVRQYFLKTCLYYFCFDESSDGTIVDFV